MRRAAALLALLLVLVGCGGDDDGSTEGESESAAPATGDAQLSREEYIAEADALCRTINDAAEVLDQRARTALAQGDLSGAAEVLEEAADEARPILDELEALPTPPGDEEFLVGYFRLIERQVALIAQMAAALRDGDTNAFAILRQQTAEVDAKDDALAAEYGFEVCGQS